MKTTRSIPQQNAPKNQLGFVLRAAYEAVSDAVLVASVSADNEAKILLANSALKTLVGINSKADAIEGARIQSLLFEPNAVAVFGDKKRYPPLDLQAILAGLGSPPGPSSAPTTHSPKMFERLLRLKPVDGVSFEVEATASELFTLNDSRTIVFTLRKLSEVTRSDQKAPTVAAKQADSVSPPISRYKNEFDEISCLGKGGFGSVYRARNKLDGIEYAVKKVKLSCTLNEFSLFVSTSGSEASRATRANSSPPLPSPLLLGQNVSETDARMLNEIKLFARLSQHPNVVSYHTAWIESVPEAVPAKIELPKSTSRSHPKKEASHGLTIATTLRKSQRSLLNIKRTESQLSTSLRSSVNGSLLSNTETNPSDDDMEDIEFSNQESLGSAVSVSTSSNASSVRPGATSDDSDTDGEDLKRFVWARNGINTKADAIAIVRTPTVRKMAPMSLPARFGTTNLNKGFSGFGSDEEETETHTISHGSSSKTLETSGDETNESDFLTNNSELNASLPGSQQNNNHKATLFIQMQLCTFTDLRTVINERRLNNRTTSPSSMKSAPKSIPNTGEDPIFQVDGVEISRSQSPENGFEQLETTRSRNLIIFRQIVEGLLHIHENQVVHRDIKPDNIFVQENFHVLVGDFGLAKSLGDHAIVPDCMMNPDVPEVENLASSDQGTFFYMAPELLEQQIYTSKTDIYSLGIILLELYHSFGTEMERILTLTELKKDPSRIPQFCHDNAASIPADVAELICMLVSTDPASRPSAMEILMDPVFDCLTPIPVSLPSPLPGSPTHSSSFTTYKNTDRRASFSHSIRAMQPFDYCHHSLTPHGHACALRQRRSGSIVSASIATAKFSCSPSSDGFASLPRTTPRSRAHTHSMSRTAESVDKQFFFSDQRENDEDSLTMADIAPAGEMHNESSLPHSQKSQVSLISKTVDTEIHNNSGSLNSNSFEKQKLPELNIDSVSLKTGSSQNGVAGVNPTTNFSEFWGRIKSVMTPKSSTGFPPVSTERETANEPNENHAIPSRNSSLEPVDSKAVLRTNGLHRKSFQVVPLKDNQSTNSTYVGEELTLPNHESFYKSKETVANSLSSSSSYSATGTADNSSNINTLNRSDNNNTNSSRISELEQNVGSLLQQIAEMKEKQRVMEAELAARGVQVVSDDES